MRTRRTWGRLLAALAVALVAAVGFAPRAARAVDGNVARVGDTEYATLQEAITSAPTDGREWDIVLIADAAIDGPTIAPTGSNISLDLDGHTVKASKTVQIRGSFVILDSSPGEGKIEGSASTLLSVNAIGAKLLLESGSVSTTGATGVAVNNAQGTFEMTGGQLGAKTNAVRASFGTTSILGGEVNGAISIKGGFPPGTPSVTIGGGDQGVPTINGEVELGLEGAELNILSGNFANDVSALLPSGKQSVQEGDNWSVKPLDAEEDAAAKVVSADGTVKLYQVASTALADLSDGDTLTLLKDSEAQLVVGGITATVDLGGHKLSSSANPVVNVNASDTNLTITNGSIVSTCEDAEGAIVGVYRGSDELQNVTLTLEGVELSATHSGGAGIIVQGNNVDNSVTLRSCELSVPSDVMGIYFPPADSVLNVIDTNITAGTGIGLKGGVLNVEGTSSITATGEKLTPGEPESSGIAETGDAIYIEGNYVDREVTLNVKGGTLKSENGLAVQKLHDDDRDEDVPVEVVITGGSFSSEPDEEWFAEGYKAEQNEDGSWGVTVPNPVAEVDGQQYPSLAAAVSAASDGDTITLLADADTSPLTIDKGVVLDLGGHTLSLIGKTGKDEAGITFTNGASTIKSGTIVDTCQIARSFAVVITGQDTSLVMEDAAVTVEVPKSGDGYGMRVLDGAGLTLNEGATVNSAPVDGNTGYIYGITVFGNKSGATFDEETATKLTVNEGATVEAYAFAVSGNGDGKKDNTLITINGGTLVSEAGPAIYHPQYGKLVINGGTLDGCSGVEIRAGELVVNGGTIKGDTSQTIVYPKDQIGGGNSVDGGGIIVAQHSTKLPVKVTVAGGTIEAYTAFIQHNVMENDQDSIDKIQMSITGGEFVGGLRSDNFKDKDDKGFVSGGSFSDGAVGDFLASDSAVAVTSGETPYDIYPSEEEALSNGGGHKVVDEQGNTWLFTSEDAANDFAESLGGGATVETIKHTVTFDDGANKVTQEVVNGAAVVKPADPARAGYAFKGWQTADGKFYDFSTPVTSDLTLTAAWEAIVPEPDEDLIEITFMNGDKVHFMAQLHRGETLAGVEVADPTWAGHTFVGWYAQVNEDGTVVVDSKVDLEKDVFNASTTLHAGFVTAGGSTPTSPDSTEKPAGLAKTSDPTAVAPLVASAAAGIAAAAGAVALRRRSK